MTSTTKSKTTTKATNGAEVNQPGGDGAVSPVHPPVEVDTTEAGTMTGDQGTAATTVVRRRGASELVTVKLSRRTYVALKVIRDKKSIDFDQIIANAVEEIANVNGVPAHILKFFLEQEGTSQ